MNAISKAAIPGAFLATVTDPEHARRLAAQYGSNADNIERHIQQTPSLQLPENAAHLDALKAGLSSKREIQARAIARAEELERQAEGPQQVGEILARAYPPGHPVHELVAQ